jgi:hypothetical protein
VWHILERYLQILSQKKQSLITTIMEVFSSIPREDLKRTCSRFRPRLEEVVADKCDFIN